MRSLQEAIGRELRWKPRSLLSRFHDLVDPQSDDGEPYATLHWRPGLMMRGPAEAESGDGRWRFRPRGLWRGQVLVLAPDDDASVATLRRFWRRSVLRFEDGREFVWRRQSWWSCSWRFEDGNGTAVVRLRGSFPIPRATARVEIDSSAAPVETRALLTCLGWYLIILARRRAAAHGGG